MAPAAEAFIEYEELEVIGSPTNFVNKNYCIGIINISKLESIQYHKEVNSIVGPGGEQGIQYHITISYLGSQMDSDATLTINGNAGHGLRDHFQTDEAMEHAIQKLINGISMAMQKAQTSNSPFVVEYYPLFDLGNTTLRSTFSPYDRDNAVDPNEELLKQVSAMLSGAAFG